MLWCPGTFQNTHTQRTSRPPHHLLLEFLMYTRYVWYAFYLLSVIGCRCACAQLAIVWIASSAWDYQHTVEHITFCYADIHIYIHIDTSIPPSKQFKTMSSILNIAKCTHTSSLVYIRGSACVTIWLQSKCFILETINCVPHIYAMQRTVVLSRVERPRLDFNTWFNFPKFVLGTKSRLQMTRRKLNQKRVTKISVIWTVIILCMG